MINRHSSPDGHGLPHRSFGVPTPYSWHLQRLLFRSPRLCALLSVGSLIFEVLAPTVLLVPEYGLFFAVSGVGFHYGIALFQNVDFVSWWGPFYSLFLFEVPTATVQGVLSLGSAYFAAHPMAFAMLSGYLSLHVLAMGFVALTGREILPFSSFHMFSEPKNLFSTRSSKTWWITEKQHATGTLKNYAFPFARPQHVKHDELHMLPFKYFVLGQRADGTTWSYSNVKVDARLQACIDGMMQQWQQGERHYMDVWSIEKALALLERGKEALHAAERDYSNAEVDEEKSEFVLTGKKARNALFDFPLPSNVDARLQGG